MRGLQQQTAEEILEVLMSLLDQCAFTCLTETHLHPFNLQHLQLYTLYNTKLKTTNYGANTEAQQLWAHNSCWTCYFAVFSPVMSVKNTE